MATSTSWLQAAKTTAPSLLSTAPPARSRISSRSSMIPRAEQKETTTTTTETTEVENPVAASTTVQSDFKGGPFTVRSDMIGALLGGALNIPFRLGSGALVKGYKIENRPAAEVGGDRYAIPFAGASSYYHVLVQNPLRGRKFVEVANPGPRPEKPIEIYEFEGCPFCRKVREIVSILDIDVLFYPCPKNGPNFRPKANQMGGKKQFPYMVDPNTNIAMYESDDIIKHLVDNYGDGKVPVMLNLGVLTTVTAGLALIGRPGKGSTYVPAKLPEKPLELWAYESSPFCKIAREALSELELPHIYHSCARGSAKRDLLLQKTGKFQVPYLEDPNTGAAMFESHDIVEYVRKTYALPAQA